MDEGEENTENIIDKMPPEILEKIFSFLGMYDLKICMEVSEAWRRTAEALNDGNWKKECQLLCKSGYKDAYRKSELSYEKLYKSLNLWPDINAANMEVFGPVELDEISCVRKPKHVKRLNFLKDGVVSYPRYDRWQSDNKYPSYFDNTVVYYYSKTLDEVDRVAYEFNFSFYEENDEFAVFQTDDCKLRILTKVDKKNHDLGKMITKFGPDSAKNFHVVGNKVFYVTEKHKLCVTSVKNNEGETALESEVILDCEKLDISFLAISDKDNKIKILTRSAEIYEIANSKIDLICAILRNITNEIIRILEEHGFDWSNEDIYEELHELIRLVNIAKPTIHTYHNVVFVGTSKRILHIYSNVYRKNKYLSLWSRKSTVKIDLSEYINIDFKRESMDSDQRKVTQIGVVEIENGHRIVLLYCERLVTIVFNYKSFKRNMNILDRKVKKMQRIDYDTFNESNWFGYESSSYSESSDITF